MSEPIVRLPSDVIRAIKKDFKVGATFREIVKKHNVSTKTARLVRDMRSVPKETGFYRDESGWPCKHSREKLEMIKRAYKLDVPVKDIAKIFQVSESYASNIVNGRERSAERD
jgi:transposase